MDSPFLKCGTKVKFIQGGVQAVISSVCVSGIQSNYVQYKVAWFAGGTRHHSWVDEFEIEIFKSTNRKAGMVDYEDEPSKSIENKQNHSPNNE